MTKFKWILLLLILPFVLNLIGNAEDIPLRVKKISDRITMFTPGLFGTQVPTTVIETKAGLVAVDTWITPSYAEMTRRRIKQELGRDDVRWVINTHSHFDHTGGNQVYADAEIIGHRNAPDEMKSFMEGKESFIQYRRGRIGQLQSRLKNLDPQSNEALSVKETIDQEETYIRDLQARYVSTPPTRTFEDRLDFTAGDLEIRLLYFGKAHTDSDIFIYIPSEGVLLVGDLFHSEHLGITAGPPLDVPRWIEVLDTVLADRQAVKTVIGGHGEILSRDWLADQFRYIRGVWEAVSKIREEGGTVDDVSAKFPLQPNFDFMAAHFDLTEESNKKRHADMIRDFWRADSRSATEEIERLLREEGIESARALFEKIRRDDTSGFYIDEAEFNQLGYTFLREQKMQEALAVLTMNSEAFPKSWNVWDSLAEVSMYTGDDQHSEEYYRKSVTLNPDNTNGIRQLSRFEGYRIDKERETQEKPRFKPGEQTGLQGPYLGQSPPGLEPKVFAPGIVSLPKSMEFSITFTPDGKEIYFTGREDEEGENTIYVCRQETDGWTAPEKAAFAEGVPSNEPFITPDGQNLYFGTNRIPPGKEQVEYAIWVVKRQGKEWGPARYHGPGMYVSSDWEGNLYMTDISNAAGGGLIRYPRLDGGYGPPERLPEAVNAPTPVAHGFISPDGSFMLFDAYNRPDAQGGEGDFYVSFRQPDKTWGNGINLGEPVNSPATHLCPALSPDGKYLFYSTCKDIYWVSTDVIKRLKMK